MTEGHMVSEVRLEAIPMMGEALQETIRRFFDNSLENIGNGNSVSRARCEINSLDSPNLKMRIVVYVLRA
jgi:hypothetical protein